MKSKFEGDDPRWDSFRDKGNIGEGIMGIVTGGSVTEVIVTHPQSLDLPITVQVPGDDITFEIRYRKKDGGIGKRRYTGKFTPRDPKNEMGAADINGTYTETRAMTEESKEYNGEQSDDVETFDGDDWTANRPPE